MLWRHSGARRSREPGIHNHQSGLWIPGLAPSGPSRNDKTKQSTKPFRSPLPAYVAALYTGRASTASWKSKYRGKPLR